MSAVIVLASTARAQLAPMDCHEQREAACSAAIRHSDVFTARLLSIDADGMSGRAQVLKHYKGTAHGEITVGISPWHDSHVLHQGVTYLFYADPGKPTDKKRYDFVIDRCASEKLAKVAGSELIFLRNLNSPPFTGSIFGSVQEEGVFVDEGNGAIVLRQVPGVKVTITNNDGSKTYTGVTTRHGFHVSVPPGDYEVTFALPKGYVADGVPRDAVHVSPHACTGVGVNVKKNAG